MVDDSIVNGDLIVLQRRSNYYNGDRVVALIDNDEVTFKELRRDKNNYGIWLIPHNVNFASQYFSSDRVIIQGALIGVMRSY
jgi:SOS-response transcriptional repressor LexA